MSFVFSNAPWMNFILRLSIGISGVWALAGIAALLCRGASAAVRHRIWSLATLAVLLLPALISLLPERRLLSPIAAKPQPIAIRSPLSMTSTAQQTTSPILELIPPTVRRSTAAVMSSSTALQRDVTSHSIDWLRISTWLWAMIAAILLARQAISVAAARRLVRRSTTLDASVASNCLARLTSGFAEHLQPRLFESSAVSTPLCIGIIRSVIILPTEWQQWPAAKLEAVVTHELAHALRRDVLWQMLGGAATAVYWPHPLAWIAAWRMRAERELACDDWVLRRGSQPAHYAGWLVDVAAAAATGHSTNVGVAMASGGGLESRICALLDAHRRRLPVSRRASIALAVATASIVVVAGIVSPLPRVRAAQADQPTTHPTTRPTTEPTPSGHTIHITGKVRTADGQQFAAGAAVKYEAFNRHITALTAADGSFDIVAEGDIIGVGMLSATSADGATMVFSRLDKETATARTAVMNLKLQLPREIAIEVIDEHGQPVSGASVETPVEPLACIGATTDSAGHATLRVPPALPLQYILVKKPGVGLDYAIFWQPSEKRTDPYRFAPDAPGPFKFVLNGAKTVVVKVVDDKGKPMPGVTVYPWLFSKPRHGDQVNLSFLISQFKQKTGADGTTTYTTVPADQTLPITFWTGAEGYTARERFVYDIAKGNGVATTTLYPLLHVTGSVTEADGQPARGVRVNAAGAGYTLDRGHAEVKTGDDGHFSVDLTPQQYYLFIASDPARHLASQTEVRVIRNATPAGTIDLKLGSATRIHGHITTDSGHQPVQDMLVDFQQDDDSYSHLAPEDRLDANDLSGRTVIKPMLPQYVKSNHDGSFEFYAGPGKYDLFPRKDPLHLESRKLTIDGEPEIEVNFTVPAGAAGERRYLTGRVVNSNAPSEGVSEATVSIVATSSKEIFSYDAITDHDGRFTIERGIGDIYLHASLPDRSRGGLIVVPSVSDPATISIGQTATATGRLLDADGKPVANCEVEFGLAKVPRMFFAGGKSTTGPDGQFALGGIIPGFDYQVLAAVRNDEFGHPDQWSYLDKVNAARPGSLDVGDQKLRRPAVAKTPADFAADAFHMAGALPDRFAKAKSIAQTQTQNVLLLIGSADLPAAKKLFEYEYIFDPANLSVQSALAGYRKMAVDIADPTAKAFIVGLGLTWPADKTMSFAAIDPTSGQVLGQASEAQLLVKGTLGRAPLVAFARAHAPAMPDAQALLDAALAQAKREGKRVLLDEGGPACSWCVKLADYLQANRGTIDKAFVWVTIDRRFTHGEAVLNRFRKQPGGIPWTAILDADAKLLITSDGPKGNIGFPGLASDLPVWEKMLRTAAPPLTEADIQSLLKPLRELAAN